MNINIFLEKNWKELEIIDSQNSKMNNYSYCWTKFLLILAYSFPKSIIRKIREQNYSHYSDSFQNISLEKFRSIRINRFRKQQRKRFLLEKFVDIIRFNYSNSFQNISLEKLRSIRIIRFRKQQRKRFLLEKFVDIIRFNYSDSFQSKNNQFVS